MMAPWLRLHLPNAGGPGLLPGQGNKHAVVKGLHAATQSVLHAATQL